MIVRIFVSRSRISFLEHLSFCSSSIIHFFNRSGIIHLGKFFSEEQQSFVVAQFHSLYSEIIREFVVMILVRYQGDQGDQGIKQQLNSGCLHQMLSRSGHYTVIIVFKIGFSKLHAFEIAPLRLFDDFSFVSTLFFRIFAQFLAKRVPQTSPLVLAASTINEIFPTESAKRVNIFQL